MVDDLSISIEGGKRQKVECFETLDWLCVALHLSAARANLRRKVAASVYLLPGKPEEYHFVD